MRKKHGIKFTPGLLLLGLLLLFIGGTLLAATQTNKGSKAKGHSMDIADKTDAHTIPLIDAAISPNFETASFGLG